MNVRTIGTVLISFVMVCGIALTGCTSPTIYQMDSGDRTAGAEGQLTVLADDNGNSVVSLSVAHLPLASRLEEGMGTYVVWVSPDDSNTHYNMGQLRLGNDRTGTLNFTTPFPNYQITVTAEVESTVLAPSNQVVLRRGVTPAR